MLLRVSSLFVCCVLLFTKQASSVIISPCKVKNLMTQPVYGTSLKTKTLVNIIQIPPVFTQNVMVGICENRNQNISTGRGGEFYVCQQRYSAVEVYIAEGAPSQPDVYRQPTADKLNSIKYIRESVIIESGCDFTFNLFPFISDLQNPLEQQQQGNTAQNIQQKMFLRSPYHPTVNIPGFQNGFRQPTASTYSNGQAQPDTSSSSSGATNSNNEGQKTYSQARASTSDDDSGDQDQVDHILKDEGFEVLE